MLKKILSIILLAPILVYSQDMIIIDGNVPETIKDKDTVYFTSGHLDKNYYETSLLSSAVMNRKFALNGNFLYPQMYYLNLGSEKDRIPQRAGMYFIDQRTKSMNVDLLTQNIEVFGDTGYEFKHVFMPYFIGVNSKESIEKYRFDNPKEFDAKLLSYVIENPNSYVALWLLIHRYNSEGYLDIYENILSSFSKKMKKEKLWKIVKGEFQQMKIHKNKRFPELILKNTGLKSEKLDLKNSKYTLIDFWFSRCRPCLEQIPFLRTIYEKYNSRGFNIIGISTDKSENIALWQKRILEKGIIWKNFLDENAVVASKEKIYSFPTNFLLNEKGEVIQKNISPEELESLLKEKLQ